MPYFLRHHLTPEHFENLAKLASLRYAEIHELEDVDVSVDLEEELVIVNGTFCEMFTVGELIQ